MSAKYICDFCKRVFDPKELTTIRISTEPTTHSRPKHLRVDADMCDECNKDIFDYIYNKIGVEHE